MGRAISMENKLEALEQRIKLIEDALEEMIQTRVHHVDLTDTNNIVAEGVVEGDVDLTDTNNIVAEGVVEGVEIKPDEEFTPPTGRRKKTMKKKTATVD